MSNTYNCVTVTTCAGSSAICLSIDHGGTIGLFHHTLWVTNYVIHMHMSFSV